MFNDVWMVQQSLLEKKEVMDKKQTLIRKINSSEKINLDRYEMIAATNTVLTPSNPLNGGGLHVKLHVNNASLSNLNMSDIGFKAETSNVICNNRANSGIVQINQYLKQNMTGNTPANTKNKFFTNHQFEMNSKANVKDSSLNANTTSENKMKSSAQIQSTNNLYISNKNIICNINLKDNDQSHVPLNQQGANSVPCISENNNNDEGNITTVEMSDDSELKTNETAFLINSHSTYNMQTAADPKISKRYHTVRAASHSSHSNNFFTQATQATQGNKADRKDLLSNLDIEVIHNLVSNINKILFVLMISNRLKWVIKKKICLKISKKRMD